MRRSIPPLLFLCACASSPSKPDVTPPAPSLRAIAASLQLQLRRGPGEPPCRKVVGSLEACPVIEEEEGGVHFLTAAELEAMEPPGDDGPPPQEHAYMIGWLSLMSTFGQAELTWVGDAQQPHRVAVMSRPGQEAFDAARLLTLPARMEELVDDFGLQFLAAVPDTHTLVLWRDEDPVALAMAKDLVAQRERQHPADLEPDTVFVVTPESFEARPWAR